MGAAIHEEPLFGPFRGYNRLIVNREIETEEDGRRQVVNVGPQGRIFRSQQPRGGRQEDAGERFGIEALNAILILVSKSGGAVWLGEEHHRHITATAPLGVERLSKVGRGMGDGRRGRHNICWIRDGVGVNSVDCGLQIDDLID